MAGVGAGGAEVGKVWVVSLVGGFFLERGCVEVGYVWFLVGAGFIWVYFGSSFLFWLVLV